MDVRQLSGSALLVVALAFAACGKKEEAPVESIPPHVLAQERERAEREQQARIEAQNKQAEAEQNADFWKSVAWGVAGFGVLFTLVGVALGSSARKHARRAQKDE